MKIIAESPEENKYLEIVENALRRVNIPLFYTETFEEAFAKESIAESISIDSKVDISEWTASQRLWFFDKCKEFFNEPNYREMKNDYINLIGIYDQIFKEERKVLDIAANDFRLFLKLQKNCELLHVDSFTKLKKFVNHSIVKGEDKDLKDVNCYFDKPLSQYVIKLNSLKIPFVFNNGKIVEDCVIYAWSDTSVEYTHEFLKGEILNKMEKANIGKSLDEKISAAGKKNTLSNIHRNREEKLIK